MLVRPGEGNYVDSAATRRDNEISLGVEADLHSSPAALWDV